MRATPQTKSRNPLSVLLISVSLGILAFVVVLVGVGRLAGGSFAQQVTVPSGVPVHMVVTVGGGSVNREDVLVHEGRDRDQVTDWVAAQGDHAALELFILLDDSSGTSLGNQLDAIRHFIMGQPSSAKIGIAYMQDGIARIEQSLTSDHSLAAQALRLPLGIRGVNASPYLSLSDLLKRWPQNDSRREVLMVSDGVDRYCVGDLPDPYLAAAIEDAQRGGVLASVIYSLGVGHCGHSCWQTGDLYLGQLADDTGGDYIGFYDPHRPAHGGPRHPERHPHPRGQPIPAFGPYLNAMAGRLNNQYLLSFLAKPRKEAGLQPVQLTTEVPHADLASADRVYVPAAH